MRRKLKRRITFHIICVIFILVILLHIYINFRLVSDWSELPHGANFVSWTISRLTNIYHTVLTQGTINITTRNYPVIIYWTTVFGRQVNANDNTTWPFFYTGDECPAKCTLTTDHGMINKASAIIIHARDIDKMPSQDKIQRKNVRWILHSNESPKFTPALNSAKIMAKFNFYLSYRPDSDFLLSLFSKPLLRPLPVPFTKKRKTLAVALYSHCEDVRTEYLIALMKEMEVDSYGSCLHNTDLPKDIGPRNMQRFSNISKHFINLYKTYKFTIVFMNSDCDYFVDEKLFYALSAGSVPVFMGTAKIREFLPGYLRDAIIEVRNFQTPKALANYMRKLATDEKAYNRFLRWKYEGFNFAESYANSSIGQFWDSSLPVFCKICQRVASGDLGRDGLPVEFCQKRSKP